MLGFLPGHYNYNVVIVTISQNTFRCCFHVWKFFTTRFDTKYLKIPEKYILFLNILYYLFYLKLFVTYKYERKKYHLFSNEAGCKNPKRQGEKLHMHNLLLNIWSFSPRTTTTFLDYCSSEFIKLLTMNVYVTKKTQRKKLL